MCLSTSSLWYTKLLYLSSSQIIMFLQAPVRALFQREVEGHHRTTPLPAPLSLTPILVCPSITPTVLCHTTESACHSLWKTRSENWTSSRKTHLSSWRTTAGRGRSPSSVTRHWPCSTANTSRSESKFIHWFIYYRTKRRQLIEAITVLSTFSGLLNNHDSKDAKAGSEHFLLHVD